MSLSNTARTLSLLREQGYTAEVVERWIPNVNIRKDLFGFIDVVAVGNGETLGIQCTSKGNVMARLRKCREIVSSNPTLRDCGWRFLVWGWGEDEGDLREEVV